MRDPGPTSHTIGNATITVEAAGGDIAVILIGSKVRLYATRENLIRIAAAIEDYLEVNRQ